MAAEILRMGSESYQRASRVVRAGGLVVYPTDTVYGLGCDPQNPDAVMRLFAAKGRDKKPVPVLCSTPDKAGELVVLSERARRLAEEHWPGALTIVAPARRELPAQLTQGGPYVGVRVPANKECVKLISLCGGWLTGTSANVSGRPSARTAAEASDQLGGSVQLILDGGRLAGTESTVVRVVGDEVTLLRTGPIGVEDEMTGRRIS